MTYEQLAILQSKYQSQGFSVLAFPSNDYRQELGTNDEIQRFVSENFPQVSFPIFGTGSLQDNPVYQQLQNQLPGDGQVRHNFFKYLVNRDGIAVKLFTKKQDPLDFVGDIEQLLASNNGSRGAGDAPFVNKVTH